MSKPSSVYFFATCVVDLMAPQAGMDAIALLRDAGLRVEFPQAQSCCGQPAYTSGYTDEARTVAAAQLDLFPEAWPIVVPSGSCAGMMVHHWPRLFAEDPARLAKARDIGARVVEFSTFARDVLGLGERLAAAPSSRPVKVALHTSCSARREMGVHVPSRALLEALPGVEVVAQAREAECCGFGGTFSLKHPDVSTAMVSDKVAALKATGASQLVTADCGCMLNITQRAAREDQDAGRSKPSLPGEHLATFLLRRTGGKQA